MTLFDAPNSPVYVGVIGSRSRDTEDDLAMVRSTVDRLVMTYPGRVVLVSGGCPKGADRFAELIARENGLPIILHHPDKDKLDPYLMERNPKAAYAKINYDRNTLIARDAKDYLIACVATTRKGGTEDTIKKWKKTNGKHGKLILA